MHMQKLTRRKRAKEKSSIRWLVEITVATKNPKVSQKTC